MKVVGKSYFFDVGDEELVGVVVVPFPEYVLDGSVVAPDD